MEELCGELLPCLRRRRLRQSLPRAAPGRVEQVIDAYRRHERILRHGHGKKLNPELLQALPLLTLVFQYLENLFGQERLLILYLS